MPLKAHLKPLANKLLQYVNLRLDTLTRERAELARLENLRQRGYFDTAQFPLPKSFYTSLHEEVLEEVAKHSARFDSFKSPDTNDVGYTFKNGFYTSLDAEVLYSVVRKYQPQRIIEVGSGNSTRLFRQAILDGKFPAQLISIDPHPRLDITSLADQIHRARVELLPSLDCFRELRKNDIFFVDSSHELKAGSDCVFLFMRVLPEIQPGVIVHFHDIFLPFDYPLEWAQTEAWAEQYLVQSMLVLDPAWEVLWPAHYLFRTQPAIARHFPHSERPDACSLWLRRLPATA